MPRSRLPVRAACRSPDKAWSQLQAGVMVCPHLESREVLDKAQGDRQSEKPPGIAVLCPHPL